MRSAPTIPEFPRRLALGLILTPLMLFPTSCRRVGEPVAADVLPLAIPLSDNRFSGRVQFSPDGTQIAVFDVARDRTVIYSVTGGGQTFELPIHFRSFSADGSLCYGNRNGRLEVYHNSTGELAYTYPTTTSGVLASDNSGVFHSFSATGCSFSPAPGQPFWDKDGSQLIYRLEPDPSSALGGGPTSIFASSPSPCGRYLLVRGVETAGRTRIREYAGIWDLAAAENGRIPFRSALPTRDQTSRFRFAPNGDHLVRLSGVENHSGSPHKVRCEGFVSASAKKYFSFNTEIDVLPDGHRAALSDDGRLLAFISSETEITLVPSADPENQRTLSPPDRSGGKPLDSVFLSPVGRSIATYATDAHQLWVWDSAQP